MQTAPWTEAQGRPRQGPANVDVQRDIIYRTVDGHNLRLDIYSPKDVTGSVPAVIWIHGGGWDHGSKEQRPPVNLMAHGYITVSIEFRLSGDAPFPAQIEDCKAAVRWLRANATKYHIDPDHIGAWGHSSGGHLAALLGTTGDVPTWDGAGENKQYSSRIQAVCDLSGPTDLTAFAQEVFTSERGPTRRARVYLEEFLGGSGAEVERKAAAASPTTYISKDAAAVLVIHGQNDMSIPVSQAREFVAKLQAAGVDATLEVAEDRGHGVGAARYAAVITAFFNKHLKPNKSL